MGSTIRNGSFFSIYVFRILSTFNIFYHIEKLLFIRYISPFFKFSHSYI